VRTCVLILAGIVVKGVGVFTPKQSLADEVKSIGATAEAAIRRAETHLFC
jgi:hypothetical protein